MFPILLKIQPDVVELTRQEYETNMGIRRERSKGKKAPVIRQGMGANPEGKDETPLSGRTKKEIIKILVKRGFKAGELNRKLKKQLIEML